MNNIDMTEMNEDDINTLNEHQDEMEECVDPVSIKRRVDDNDQEWQVVVGKEKKIKNDLIEVYITSNEKMPKLFSLAKFFKSLGLNEIKKVKYVTPFKVRVDLSSEASACVLENTPELINKGWRTNRAMESKTSFGVIKNVDVDIEDEEIMKSVSCPNDAELLSVHRLSRRTSSGDGWVKSESIRLCFKGSFLPAYITVDGLHIKVDPYIFPVSQCSMCWKFGHIKKRCPTNKITCPKCGGEHANCETRSFRCVNCGGKHMALEKTCPRFLKEKKLREIMAEFNCTYRRALTMYVSPHPMENNSQSIPQTNATFAEQVHLSPHTPVVEQSYAEIVKAKVHPAKKSSTKKRRSRSPSPYVWSEMLNSPPDPVTVPSEDMNQEQKRERKVKFRELWERLSEIVFMRGVMMQDKVKMGIKCCVEWIVLLIADFIPEWPILQTAFDYLCNNG